MGTNRTRAAIWIAWVSLPMAIAGCGASLDNLTTGSLLGPKAPEPPKNDPVSRAMQVGTTSARAVKCGFNFDPAKLKANFISAETAANPADAAKLAQIYDVSFNGISKAVASKDEAYCSETKTAKIKEALNRHLSGDYAAPPPEPDVVEQGLFGDLGSSSASTYKDNNPWRNDE